MSEYKNLIEWLDEQIRSFWYDLYSAICRALHVSVEAEADLDARLADVLEGGV